MSSDPAPLNDSDHRNFRRVLGCFVLILVVLVGVVVVSLRNLNRSVATADWVNHTHALITELDSLQPLLSAAEGDLSRYLLTSDQRDHLDYQDKFAQLGESVNVINALIAESADEKALFAPIATVLTRRAELANQIVQVRKSGDPDAVKKLLADDAESADRRELARSVEKFRERQAELLNERDRLSFIQAETTRWTVLSGVLLDFLLLCGAAWLIRDDLAARRRATSLLEQTNEQLEAKVQQRTAELKATNSQLTLQNIEDRWARAALEHQNRYNLLIIDSISDAVFVITKLMNISRMNPAAVHLTGYEPVDVVDRPLARLLRLEGHDPTKAAYDPLARTLVDGHELRDKPAIVTTKLGQSSFVRLSVFPLRDGDKVVGGVVVLEPLAPLLP
jgi:PAS domain S-box-containing protein